MAIVYENNYSGKSKLGIAIESTIKMLMKKRTYATIRKDTPCDELSNIISKLTGGKVRVKLGAFDYVNAYAHIPMLDNNNPLITKSITRGPIKKGLDLDLDYKRFKKAHPELTGGFDFKKNQFTGWAKEIEYNLCLGYRCIYPKSDDKDMNPEVATYILLHEFGHLIEKIFGVGTLVRENYVLNQAHSRLMGEGTTEKRIKVIQRIAKEEGIEADELIENIDNDTTLYVTMVGKLRGEIRSELDSYGYDQTGFESLADYYAVKQGYGAGAIYLAKPMPGGLSPDDVQYIISWTFSAAILGLWASSLTVYGSVLSLGMAYSALAGYSYDSSVQRYDNSYDRLQRALNAYIESIKSGKTKVSKEDLDNANKMIKALESMDSGQRGVMQSIFEYVNPRGRKERNARDLQKSLESLVNHKLHLKVRQYTS